MYTHLLAYIQYMAIYMSLVKPRRAPIQKCRHGKLVATTACILRVYNMTISLRRMTVEDASKAAESNPWISLFDTAPRWESRRIMVQPAPWQNDCPLFSHLLHIILWPLIIFGDHNYKISYILWWWLTWHQLQV